MKIGVAAWRLRWKYFPIYNVPPNDKVNMEFKQLASLYIYMQEKSTFDVHFKLMFNSLSTWLFMSNGILWTVLTFELHIKHICNKKIHGMRITIENK